MLTRAGIEEERAVYLCDYNNVVQDLGNPSPDEWALVRAAMLHITLSEDLRSEHNRWLGQQIFGSFEKEAQYHSALGLTEDGERSGNAGGPW